MKAVHKYSGNGKYKICLDITETEGHGLICVDALNRAIGSASKERCHKDRTLHRAFFIFLVDGTKILLQQSHCEISLRRTVDQRMLLSSEMGRNAGLRGEQIIV